MTQAATALYLLHSAVLAAFGARYLMGRPMPYHAAALGRALEPGLQAVVQALMRVAGGGMLAAGVAGAGLAVGVPRGLAWACVVPVPYLLVGGAAWWAAWGVRRRTGARTPVGLCALSVAAALAAWGLSLAGL